MKKNMGMFDRGFRIGVAIVIAILFFTNAIPHVWWGWLLLVLAGVFLLTSLVNHCPLYTVLGIRTNVKKDE